MVDAITTKELAERTGVSGRIIEELVGQIDTFRLIDDTGNVWVSPQMIEAALNYRDFRTIKGEYYNG